MRQFVVPMLILASSAVAALPCGAAGKVTPAHVSIQTPDGVALAGTYWGQGGKSGGVLLLHMVGRDRSDWDAMGDALSAAGFSVLAIDFRGHGESLKQGARSLNQADFSDKDWRGVVTDAVASLDWLAAQPGVDATRLAIAGASIGANTALLAGAPDKRVKTLVLLSPGLDYRGLKTERAMDQLGTRSAFLVASDADEPSARAVKRLASLARGRSATKVFPKAGHGTEMFGAEPTLKVQVAGWLKENL